MAIEIPTRKNVKARAIAEQHPDLSPADVAKLADLNDGVNAGRVGFPAGSEMRRGATTLKQALRRLVEAAR